MKTSFQIAVWDPALFGKPEGERRTPMRYAVELRETCPAIKNVKCLGWYPDGTLACEGQMEETDALLLNDFLEENGYEVRIVENVTACRFSFDDPFSDIWNQRNNQRAEQWEKEHKGGQHA